MRLWFAARGPLWRTVAMEAFTKYDLNRQLHTGLSARMLDGQHLTKLVQALRRSDLDAVSRLHCERLIVLLRDVSTDHSPPRNFRQKLTKTLSLIQIEGSPVAIQSSRMVK